MLEAETKVLKTAVLKAGQIVRAANPVGGVAQKPGRGNFTTDADMASEKAIIDLIRQHFPNDQIMAEETASIVNEPLEVKRLWVIDPIDGTNNFGHGRNHSSVSIGFVEKGVLRAGIVYNPYLKELFTAQQGGGAQLNGEPIKTGNLKELNQGSVATDNAYSDAGTRYNLELLLKLSPLPWCLIPSCASLTMCAVAAGRIDLFFHTFLKPWDNAAAFLIAEEAGAQVCDLDGKAISFLSEDVIIGNPRIVKQFLDQIKS